MIGPKKKSIKIKVKYLDPPPRPSANTAWWLPPQDCPEPNEYKCILYLVDSKLESAKTVEQKDSEPTSSPRNTNITIIYTASIFKNWNLPEKNLQSKIERRTHKARRGGRGSYSTGKPHAHRQPADGRMITL